MIEILKTTDNKLIELGINEAQSGSWFNLIEPTYDEIQKVSLILNLDESFLRNSLDVDERSRIEIEDDCLLIITNIPTMEDEGTYDTLPLGIIFTDRGFITDPAGRSVCVAKFCILFPLFSPIAPTTPKISPVVGSITIADDSGVLSPFTS